jgi:hypothetical protein
MDLCSVYSTPLVLPMEADSEQESMDQGILPTKEYEIIDMSSRMDTMMIP